MSQTTVENLGGAVFLLLVVAALVLLVRRMRSTRGVDAYEVVRVPGAPEVVGPEILAALGAVRGARVASLSPDHARVSIRRTPPWTVVPALLLFPVGLVALLYRESVHLDVSIVRAGTGTDVRLTGRTESAVLSRVRSAVAAVDVDVQSDPVDAR